MSDLYSFIQNHIPLLEKYILAMAISNNQRQSFINSLMNSNDKKILALMTEPIVSEASKQFMKQSKLSKNAINQVVNSKWMVQLRTQTDVQKKRQALKNIKQNYSHLRFDFTKPADLNQLNGVNFTKTTETNDIKVQDNSKLNLPQSLTELLQDKIKGNDKIFRNLNMYGIKQLSLSTLKSLSNENKYLLMQNAEFYNAFQDEFVVNFLLDTVTPISVIKKTSIFDQIPFNILNAMSVSQINLLAKKQQKALQNSQFVKIWFDLNYTSLLQNLNQNNGNKKMTLTSMDKKRKALINIREQLKKKNCHFLKSYQNQIFLQILLLDLERQDPDIKLFIEYIQNQTVASPYFNKIYRQQIKNKFGKTPSTSVIVINSNSLLSTKSSLDSTIDKYLNKLFQKYTNSTEQLVQKLSKYLDEKMIRKYQVQVKLSQGIQIPNLHSILDLARIQALKDSKQITIVGKKTQSFFKSNDDVVLHLKIKNVKQIHLKIYQMDLQQYYLQNQSEIDETLNLSYLNPSISQVIQVKELKNSFNSIKYELKLQQIQKKYGFYIVELYGEGITSRAIIRKGSIACIEQNNINGKKLSFYDDQGQKIDKLNLWIRGRHETIQNGQHLIPFSKTNQSVRIIAVKDKYATSMRISSNPQNYTFRADFLYNTQSFIAGKKCKIIIHPVLKLGNDIISLKNLQNIRVQVDLMNNMKIRSNMKFQNIKLKDDSDYILEFPLKSYTSALAIRIFCQTTDLNKKTINFSASKSILIDLGEDNTNILDMYLQRTDSGRNNVLNVLGLNGQKLASMQANLTMKYFGFNEIESKQLKTNEDGQINLGSLQYVQTLQASILTKVGRKIRNWNFNVQSQEVSYLTTQKLFYVQGDDLTLPIPFSSWKLSQKNIQNFISFKKLYRNNSFTNILPKINIKNQNGFTLLSLPNMQAGQYYFTFFKLNNLVLNIKVLKGKKISNNQIFDQKTNTITKLCRISKSFITLGQIIEDNQKIDQKYRYLTLNLHTPLTQEKNSLTDLRVHVFLQNYYDSQILNVTNCFLPQMFNQKGQISSGYLSVKPSTFYNNKKLSDQQAYVLNRANQKQFIGNNLQKPKIFIKRIEVRDTSEKQQQLNAQTAYSKENEHLDILQNCSRGMNNMCYSKEACLNDFSGGYSNNNKAYYSSSYNSVLSNNLSSHNNFINVSGHLISNLKKDKLQLKVPHGYTNLTVYLITSETGSKKNYFLEKQPKNSKINKKDLRHCGLVENDQKVGWTLSREIYSLQVGQKKQVNRSSTWCTVSLFNILQYAQTKNIALPEWISQWNSYDQNKKLQVYDKQICHQLNVFIKFNDFSFFENVVKKHIKNKVIKTFIDLYLLNDLSAFKFAQTHSILKLNQFEKILLIDQLVKNQKVQEAKKIANSMELLEKTKSRNFDQYKNLFDTILNSEASPKPQIRTSTTSMLFTNQQQQFQPSGLFGFSASSPMSQTRGFGGSRGRNSSLRAFNAPVNLMEQSQKCDMDDQYQCGGEQDEQQCQQQKLECCLLGDQQLLPARQLKKMDKKAYKPGFQQVEKTKQYTETTYSSMKDAKQSQNLIQSNIFWSKLASHIVQNYQNKKAFLSDSFLFLSTKIQFTLACIFISSEALADYQLSNQEDNYVIEAKSPFLIFVKQVKEVEYADKFGVLINQRFLNPDDRFVIEQDGTQIQKNVDQFIVRRPYCVQTVITNTSGTNLELQILIDIPSGSIPLLSHEYAQIINASIGSYSTRSFERLFYFPEEGEYDIYSANVCRNNTVISKSKKLPKILVKSKQTINKLQSFNDVLRSGSQKQILEFIQKKNIFDNKVFSPFNIFWMLKQKNFFNEIISILKKRNYYENNIWSFGFYHDDDQIIQQYLQKNSTNLTPLKTYQIPIFEYFPYYSNRTHKFLNQSKSTIRNVQFKQTYNNFIYKSILQNQITKESSQKIAFAYYLILQDRIDQAQTMLKSFTKQERQNHQLQIDYLDCYLDMYQGYPNFKKAQQITPKYLSYPIKSWQTLYKQIYDTLQQYQNDSLYSQDQKQKINTQYKTIVINQGEALKLTIPPQTRVQVFFYDINLELYFSDYPFEDVKSLSLIKPKIVKKFENGQSRQERINISEVNSLVNVIVQVYEFKENIPSKKISSFFWCNPKMKVKLNQKEGSLQVFFDGKKQSGCYVKVYSNGSKGNKFYRDGYTDITGNFKYALNDLQGINQFSILTIMKQGGIISKVTPPSTAGHY